MVFPHPSEKYARHNTPLAPNLQNYPGKRPQTVSKKQTKNQVKPIITHTTEKYEFSGRMLTTAPPQKHHDKTTILQNTEKYEFLGRMLTPVRVLGPDVDPGC